MPSNEHVATAGMETAKATASEDDYFDLIEYLEEALRKELEDFEQEQQVNELLKYEEESLAALIAQMDVKDSAVQAMQDEL